MSVGRSEEEVVVAVFVVVVMCRKRRTEDLVARCVVCLRVRGTAELDAQVDVAGNKSVCIGLQYSRVKV